jgi:hypothetical protein
MTNATIDKVNYVKLERSVHVRKGKWFRFSEEQIQRMRKAWRNLLGKAAPHRGSRSPAHAAARSFEMAHECAPVCRA